MQQRTVLTTTIYTLFLCFIIAILEGFDLQSMGVAAPRMKAEMGLENSQMAWIFSAAVLGTLPGALLAGRCADIFGRKNVLITCIFLFGVMSLCTPFVGHFDLLILIRFLTGLGMGGALPLVITLVSEAVSERHKATAVSIMYCGMPVGGILSSVVALSLNADHEWRHIFYFGGICPILLVPFLIWLLPESRDYLALKQQSVLSEKIGFMHAIFSKQRIFITLCLWLSFFGTLLVLTLLQNWLPTLMTNLGASKATSNYVQIGFNLGGAIGALVLGILLDRINKHIVITLVYLGILASLSGLAFSAQSHTLIFAAACSGLFIIGCQSILYSLAAKYYPTHMRGSGVGAAVAVGRIGSFTGPLIAGYLLSMGQNEAFVIASSLPMILVAAIAALFLLRQPLPYNSNTSDTDKSKLLKF
ncbi:3-(3-hydroxy-phenyl)propionate transporter MhpT [Acinetobacter qingfengensis]|nr:3-(3-hydroxy-phenyl)propionate transporter MhpT [Acinetobacter qingfengensis]